MESRACLVCLAVYNDAISFEDLINFKFDDNDQGTIRDFFERIVVLCQLYDLEDRGIVQKNGEKISLTNFGKGWADRAAKKAQALLREK